MCYNRYMKTYLYLITLLITIANLNANADIVTEKAVKTFVSKFDQRQKEIKTVVAQIKSNKPDISDKYAKALAEEIYTHSTAHRIDPKLVAAILALESMYDHKAYNKRSKDYGIAQINVKTVSRYKLDKKKLLSDISYTIKAGVLVLSYFHKRYAHKESNWYVRYNVGTGTKANKSKAAKHYQSMIAKYL